MSFYRDKIEEFFLLDTPVENIFIHEFMPAAPDGYLKVYLLALMHADLGVEITREGIARHLNMEEEDVLKAWNYWEKMGVIRKRSKEDGDQFDYDVEFITLRQKMYGSSEADAADGGYQIGDMMSDPQIQSLISGIEQTTGRVFGSTEIRDVLSWIDDYGMTPEAIAFAFAYSKKHRRKSDIRYVGGILRQWATADLRNVADIEEHLAKIDRQNTMHRRVFRALGFTRNATEEEKRIMDEWFDEMNIPLETVLEACKKTSGINNPNINYVNRILQNWNKDGNIITGEKGEVISQQQVNEYYEALRERAEAEAGRRRDEVYEKIPRIHKIDEELSGIGPELSRLVISDAVDRNKKAEDLRKKEEELQMEKAFLLTDNGFELDYMDLKYECPDCEDTGRLATGEACQCTEKITREKIDKVLSLKK